jgi:hypothetical protein
MAQNPKWVDEMHQAERQHIFASPLSSESKLPHALLEGEIDMHTDLQEAFLLLLAFFISQSTNIDTYTHINTHSYDYIHTLCHIHVHPILMNTSKRLSRFDLEIYEVDEKMLYIRTLNPITTSTHTRLKNHLSSVCAYSAF